MSPVNAVEAESAGFNRGRLARVEQWLERQVSSNRLAGGSVLIGRHGSVALFKAVGDHERESIVRLYSMTKPVTSVAAMMLYERGLFQLDDPIALYLPEFVDTPVWNGSALPSEETELDADAILGHVVAQQLPITVRQLMNHTSGLTYSFMNATPVDAYYRHHNLIFPGADESLASIVSRVAKAPLLCQPGTAWNYSVSTDVLGRLVEIWAGMTLEQFFTDEILKPLGMHETGFQVRDGSNDRLRDLYTPAAGGSLGGVNAVAEDLLRLRIASVQREREGLQPPVVMEAAHASSFNATPALLSGGGGLVGSIDDYARFCQMLLNGGEFAGERLLSRKSVEFMRCNHLPDGRDMAAMGQAVWSETTYQGIGFGLGFAVVLDPVKAQMLSTVGEHHWGGAASTFFWIDPVEDLYVVFLTQLFPSSSYPIRRELRTLVYQALES